MREKAFAVLKIFPLTRAFPCGIINPALGNAFLSCRSGGIGRRPGLKILCSKRTCRFDPGLRYQQLYRGVEQFGSSSGS